MTINNMSELNKAVQEFEQLISVYKTAGITQFPQAVYDKETQIERFKFENDIIDRCTTCGAWAKKDGLFAVNFGSDMSPERLYGRVCQRAKDKPCLNGVPENPQAAIDEHDYKPLTGDFLDTAIRLKGLSNDFDA